ncbi:MAG TPA: hypothetical protein VJ020_14465, partial [Anaerolineales bacterium]|nr:hypothetical protein [Anaerolineales bacterium]
TEGNFWAWTYQPIGKGARSGKATTWKMKQLVRCSKRKTAERNAFLRLQKAQIKAKPSTPTE